MSGPKSGGRWVVPVFVLTARQVVRLPLRVFMGREILIALRAEVDGLVADAHGVLFFPARLLFVRMTFIYSPQHKPAELSELSSSCVSVVTIANDQQPPQQLERREHALHT